MSENLKHMLRDAIYGAFHEGMDKHAASKEERRGKIYSHTSKKRLKERMDAFSEWVKETHPEIYNLPIEKSMTPKLIREYMDAKTGVCSQKTLDNYRSDFAKIGILISKQKHKKIDLSIERIMSVQDAPKTSRGSDAIPSKSDMDKLIAYASEHPSRSVAAILLQRYVGIRVSEMSYRVRIVGTTLKVTGKGGKKYPDMPVTPEIAKLLNSAEWKKTILDADGKFKFPKPKSINKYLNRTQDKLHIERHSFHDLRRYHATEQYNDLRRNGMERGEVIKCVNQILNHGSDRGEKLLHESYVKDLW